MGEAASTLEPLKWFLQKDLLVKYDEMKLRTIHESYPFEAGLCGEDRGSSPQRTPRVQREIGLC